MFTTTRICSSHEMKEIDLIAEKQYGIESHLLMENAGRAATQIILERYPHMGRNSEILIFAGKGNNAGDAFVVARRLICLERKVKVFHLQNENGYKEAAYKNFLILKKMKARLIFLESISDLNAFFETFPGPFSIIDGMLGTGLKSELEGIFYDVVEAINKHNPSELIALDIPSGVSGDTGQIHGTSIHATLTISFGFPKLGHFFSPGAGKRGELINVDISLPPRFLKEGDKFLLTKNPMSFLITERDRYGHKNAFGHSLLIGGSLGRFGAISMAAAACHKMGTGLVTVATWPEEFKIMLPQLPLETMAVPLELNGPNKECFYQLYSSIIIGPGLGLRPEGKKLIENLLSHYQGPIVFDADALNLVSEYKLHPFLVDRRAPTVLTPHIGEMARLLSVSNDEISKNPIQAIRESVRMTHAIVLLKGAATLIGSPEDVLYLNHYPNDGMATAGSGDVLSGMIGGLLGQKMDPFEATLLGVFLHSLAGDFAAKKQGHRSMTAPDIIENIGNAFKYLKTTENPIPLESRIRIL